MRPWDQTPRAIRAVVIDGLRDDAFLVRDHAEPALSRREAEAYARGYEALRAFCLAIEAAPGSAWYRARAAAERGDPYDVVW